MTKEIRNRRKELNFDENDIERLQQKLNQIEILVNRLVRSTETNAAIVTNDQINWNRVIYVESNHARMASLRSSSVDIHPNAKWKQTGVTVAGGNEEGNGINQLNCSWGLYVDDEQTAYVADESNHRIIEWKSGATNGRIVAGGKENVANRLNRPEDVIVDKERNSLIISDFGNKRLVRWPRQNDTNGEIIISNIYCVVAGGNGEGNRLDQLLNPYYLFVDRNHSVYASDNTNHRVTKWEEGAKQGIVVAGGQGYGNELTQLNGPLGIVVDQLGTVYVADRSNHRIMRWPKGSTQGTVIVGGNGPGAQSNQLSYPYGLSFDRHGSLYVADQCNHRIQKFDIE
ncbi:unnamed protein product [Rotaria sp. Silwood2]|nr:unnamed protein product [Rotaria sp. Silwood2]